MRKWLVVTVVAVAGALGTANRAAAYGLGLTHSPYYASAVFPCLNPPGYFSNSYYFAWYYPWYANYNYAHGPYANWWHTGGFATYGGNCGPHGCGHQAMTPTQAPGLLTVTLPADAKLLFNGTAAAGTGAVRTFATPPLAAGQDYGYDLTLQVTRAGEVVTTTERVVVRAGQETKVTLAPK